MSDQIGTERKKPTFGYFQDGQFQSLDVEPTAPDDRVLAGLTDKNPVEDASEFSKLLRNGT